MDGETPQPGPLEPEIVLPRGKAEPPVAAVPPPPSPEIEALRRKAAERDEVQDRYLRLAAEFDNFKKRLARDRAGWSERAIAEFLRPLLPILDNIHRALEAANGGRDLRGLYEGVRIMEAAIRDHFSRHGVVEIPAAGLPFDAAIHEAVVQEETDRCPEGTVLEVLERGYRQGDRLLKPARVKIARRPAAPPRPAP